MTLKKFAALFLLSFTGIFLSAGISAKSDSHKGNPVNKYKEPFSEVFNINTVESGNNFEIVFSKKGYAVICRESDVQRQNFYYTYTTGKGKVFLKGACIIVFDGEIWRKHIGVPEDIELTLTDSRKPEYVMSGTGSQSGVTYRVSYLEKPKHSFMSYDAEWIVRFCAGGFLDNPQNVWKVTDPDGIKVVNIEGDSETEFGYGDIIIGSPDEKNDGYIAIDYIKGRKLYAEIAMVEEEHVTQYESLLDPNLTWLENWVLHEYTEAYLYYSMALDESDPNIKSIYESHYEMEAAHLKKAVECLKKYENKTPESLLKVTRFPEPLKFGSNKEFIRRVLERTSELTAEKDGYILVDHLDENSDFAEYQRMINSDPESVPSHAVIKRTIKKFGEDYRYEDAPNPVAALRPRDRDNTTLGRVVK